MAATVDQMQTVIQGVDVERLVRCVSQKALQLAGTSVLPDASILVLMSQVPEGVVPAASHLTHTRLLTGKEVSWVCSKLPPTTTDLRLHLDSPTSSLLNPKLLHGEGEAKTAALMLAVLMMCSTFRAHTPGDAAVGVFADWPDRCSEGLEAWPPVRLTLHYKTSTDQLLNQMRIARTLNLTGQRGPADGKGEV